MKSKLWVIWVVLILMGISVAGFGQDAPEDQKPVVRVITIDGSINPGSADFIINSIENAKESGASLLVVELDTPGGLVESTRDIVQALLNSTIPVVVYVTPPGAHAGSAGVMITLAANVAAMAPGTNIGAATPVSGTGEMDETMKNKVTNDVAAWVEGIAEKRERNKDWAIRAVREAVSVTATEAKKLKVIDVLADDLPTLLEKIDGMKVKIEGKEIALKSKDAAIERVEMGWKHKVLNLLADPNLAYIFMIIGFLGLYAEFSHPGLIVPGVVGGVCLILFLMASQILPINTLGLLLILAGIILFILEIKFTSYGMLTIGGLACLTIGSLFLFDVPEKIVDYPAYNLQVSWSYIVPSVLIIGGFILGITYLIVKAHGRKPETGNEGMIGREGIADVDLTPGEIGKIKIRGEIWKAESDKPIEKDQRVVVTAASTTSLLLKVKRVVKKTQL